MKTIPLVLFTYNRPDLLRQTLESLAKNTIAMQTDMIVFSDGPKPDATTIQQEKIREVRTILREKNWCKSITIIEAPENNGLAKSVIEGVSMVLSKHEKVIVIEDDILLSAFFLQYMNDSLNHYESNSKVFAVGAWTYFTRSDFNNETFFLRYPDSIAWGTFKRSWDLFEYDAKNLQEKLIATKRMSAFNGFRNLKYFEPMLQSFIDGKIDSWAIRWTATSILHQGLSVFPPVSMVKHMGFSSDGTHERMADYNADLVLAHTAVSKMNDNVTESPIAFQDWRNFIKDRFLHSSSRKVKLLNTIRENLPKFIHDILFR
ncbi:MAG: glycosyltransferase [Bacteroidetes bacterium]|nr:glycosyltransferase [Bacteroidota bacterium]